MVVAAQILEIVRDIRALEVRAAEETPRGQK